MDPVRFGRALGLGARSAAKALAAAADAATGPSSSPVRPRSTAPQSTQTAVPKPVSGFAATSPIASAARSAAHATFQARKTSEGVARGSKRFGEAIWGPFVKVSGVLWLEVTGSFFGIFALFAGQAVWTHRADLFSVATDRDDRIRAFVFVGMALGFGYFCISSFVRARRRERRS